MPRRRPSKTAVPSVDWSLYDQRLLIKLVRNMTRILALKADKDSAKRGKPTGPRTFKPRQRSGLTSKMVPGTKVDWTDPRFFRLLGSDKDEIIAKRLGISDRTVRTQRDRAGIPPFRAKRWTPKVIAMLGRVPDDILAERLGVRPTAVRYQREKRDIPEIRARQDRQKKKGR